MAKPYYYRGAIWTNHALVKLGKRGLSIEMAADAFNKPDVSKRGKNPGTHEYSKKFGKSTITVIAKQNDKNEWIIISNWIDPPFSGTEDHIKKKEWKNYQKSGFWSKFFYTVKKQLGL